MAKRKHDDGVAPFINHLWEMLEEPAHAPYIAWVTSQNEQGESVYHVKIVDKDGTTCEVYDCVEKAAKAAVAADKAAA